MSYWQGQPVSSGCWCHMPISVGWLETILNIPTFGWLRRSPELRLLDLPDWIAEGGCTTFGDSHLSQQQCSCCRVPINSTWWLDIKFSNVFFHSSRFEKKVPASILAAISTTRVLFAGKMEASCVGSTEWLIISLSITRINALLTGVSLSIATAFKEGTLRIQWYPFAFHIFHVDHQVSCSLWSPVWKPSGRSSPSPSITTSSTQTQWTTSPGSPSS